MAYDMLMIFWKMAKNQQIQQLAYTFTYLSSVEGNDGVSLVNGSGSYPQVLKSCDGWNIELIVLRMGSR